MTSPDQRQQMEQLEAKLAAAKQRGAPKPRADEHYSQANMAWRMVIELVAGLGIGFGIGYGLDVLFGTLPIFMVLFVMQKQRGVLYDYLGHLPLEEDEA